MDSTLFDRFTLTQRVKINLDTVSKYDTKPLMRMQKKHRATLLKIFHRPTLGTIKWRDIEALFLALGAEVEERSGSRIAVILHDSVQIFHRPHPSPDTNKGAVAAVKLFLTNHNIRP